MDALPYYKWNWQDWRASRRVQRMTYVDRGLYRELLDEQWKEGSLPSTMEDLADICGCPVDVMADSWNRLRFHFDESDGRLVNSTLEKMRTVTDAVRVANARNGQAGAFKKQANAAQDEANAAQDEANASERQRSPDGRQRSPDGRHIEEKRREEKTREEKTREDLKPLASTASAVPAERGKLLGTLPCTGGFEYEVREDDLSRDSALYPAVDVQQAYREMKGWLLVDKQRQKTKSGIRRFMNSWLSRAQNKPHPVGGNNGFKGKTESTLDAAQSAIRAIQNRSAADQAGDTPPGTTDRPRLSSICGRLGRI